MIPNLVALANGPAPLTRCINNNQAKLTDADEEVPYPGPFSGSCIDCGITTTEPVGEGDSDWRVHLRCQCADKDQPKDMRFTEISLGMFI